MTDEAPSPARGGGSGRGLSDGTNRSLVTPAKAGVHTTECAESEYAGTLQNIARAARWTPAFAGVTTKKPSGGTIEP